MVWSNYSKSVQNSNNVFIPADVKELQSIVVSARKRNQHLRVQSAGHSYASNITSESAEEAKEVAIIDMKQFNTIQIAKNRTRVTVGPAVQFDALLSYLEAQDLTLPNFTGCLDLSVSGTTSAASHGTGFHASVADVVMSLTLLLDDGKTLQRIDKTADAKTFRLVCGGQGTLGIITELELECKPAQLCSESHKRYDLSGPVRDPEVVELISSMSPTATDVFDHAFWIPISHRLFYFKRRLLDRNDTAQQANTESWFGRFSDSLSPPAAKLLNASRVGNWILPSTAYGTLNTLYGLDVQQLSTLNSMYRLEKPVSDLALNLQPYFEISIDCELFFPVDAKAGGILEALDLYNFMYQVILFRYSPDEVEAKIPSHDKYRSQLAAVNLWEDLLQCIHPNALFTAPPEVRYVPRTENAVLAPNYQQDVWSVSIAWFGERSKAQHYRRTMDLFLKVCMRVYGGKFHFGKYHPIAELNRNDPFLKEIRKRYEKELAMYKGKVSPLFRNDFINNLFLQ